VVELHVPGSPPLLAALVRDLEGKGARAARPGEFTRRAFLSGRLDLAQAEAVLALTSAEEDGDARAAARALAGGLARAIDGTKADVLGLLAHVEATIDFPEEDLPGLDSAAVLADKAERAEASLAALAAGALAPRVAGTLPVVALAGLANAGKSTLLNALAGREAALVSSVAGTTRDPVAALVDLGGGVFARVLDGAGEKTATSEVERAALDRAREQARSADLVLYLFDPATTDEATARARLDSLGARASILVASKADLAPAASDRALHVSALCVSDLCVSATTGAGMDSLRSAIARTFAQAPLSSDLVQTERQAREVGRARDSLARAAALLRSDEPARLELAAVDLRETLDALGQLTGSVATDDLLDGIFGRFCIGK
jgi:tRNA modification GTPase